MKKSHSQGFVSNSDLRRCNSFSYDCRLISSYTIEHNICLDKIIMTPT